MYNAEYFIKNLSMESHIEGGYFKETYKNSFMVDSQILNEDIEGERFLSSTIYYLLKSGQVSKFHKLKFDEIWFYQYGSPLKIYMIDEFGILNTQILGLNISKGESPQILVNSKVIFGAEVVDKDSFSLVSCMVSPGFDYRDFTIYSIDDLILQFPHHKDIIINIYK